MSADLAARLRALTQDYHEGRLNLAAYRALRAPLLDTLVANVPAAADMEVTRPRAVRPAPAPTTGQTTGQATAQTPSPTQSRRRLPVGVIVVALGLVALVTVMLWVLSRGGHPGAEADAVSGGRALAGPVYDVVVPFMERGDWSDAQLTALNASLLELGDQQLATVARERWFQRFVDEVRSRLKEHQALAAAPLTADNSAVAALAVTVGLDLDSPDAGIHIASVRAPASTPAEPHEAGTPPAANRAHAPASEAPAIEGAGASSKSEVNPRAHASSGGAGTATSGNLDTGAGGATDTAAKTKAPAVASSAHASPKASSENACRLELIGSRRPFCSDPLPTGEGPMLALVPAGSFDMGSTAADAERPVHRVTISAPFAVSVNEVSQAEYKQFCDHTGRSCAAQPWVGDDYPVVNVSWDDARAYTEWLSSVTHERYRLPSEAQWEYAARAGQAGPFPGGDSLSPTDAHFSAAVKQTAPARRSEKFKPNRFRLLHTLGNVREWVADAWAPSYEGAPADGSAVGAAAGAEVMRVTRGGSYADGAARLRLSLREGLPSGTRDPFTGFRVVRELP
jgi:formylglycine-generating enzyme required for sulfatase activity